AVTGSASITSTDTPTSQAGTTYPITATLGTLAAKNYTFAFAPGTLTITQATTSSYTITWKSQSAVYGTALGSPTLTASSSIAGSFAYSPSGVLQVGPAVAVVATFTPTDTTDYPTQTATANITITPAVLTVTASNATRAYGTPDPTFTDAISGLVNGDTLASAVTGSASITATDTPTSQAGTTYPITATLGTLAAKNYTFAFAPGTLTITQATTSSYTITWKSQSAVYGTALGSPTLTASSSIAGSFSYSPSGVLQVGPAVAVIATFTPTDTTDYPSQSATANITITPAVLTVTASNATRAYGSANPTFTGTITGAVNGDTFTESFSTTATTSSPAGTYPIVPAPIGTALSNYTVNVTDGTLTIGKVTLTVTAANATRAYGAANPTFSASATGAQNSDTFTFTETTTATPSSPTGTYSIVPVASGANLSDYNVVYVNGTLTITQATLTVTAADASRAFGAANPTFSASAAGAASGDTFTFTESTPATSSSPVGTYPIIPVATGTNIANYNVVYVNGTLSIGQATLTVTAANATRAYGAPNPTFSASAVGAQNGDSFTFSESTAATTTSPIGNYPIIPTASGANLSNYTVTYVNGTLTIGQATLTVTAANATRAYGAANPTFSASATGAQNGDSFTFSESTSATTTSPIGNYPIVPTASGANLANYNVTYVNGTLTVGQATLTVTAADANRTYGTPNPTFSASATGAQNGDTFTFTESTSATPASPAGTYPIIPVATGANLGNYTVVYDNGTLTITKATLTVTAADANRTYGTPNPTFSASATGAQNGDSFTYTETTPATTASPIGTYPIVPTAAGANLSNYTVVYNNGTLTIGKATLTVTAADANRTYGIPNPTFSASATGAQNGDSFTYTETTTATTASPIGTYPIVPTAAGANLNNYTVVYDNGTLTIGKATLTVTAADANRTYGTPNPTFSASATGAQNGDTFTFTESTPATIASAPGTYAITPVATGANIADYNVTYVNGTLTIGKATLTVTAADANRTYGAANPAFSASATGAQNGDTFTFTESTSATATSPVGTYPIVPTATGANIADYNVVYANGTLTVTQVTLTVTAANASRTYGATNPAFSASASGAVNGDTFTFTESTSATATSPVGTYAIVPLASGTNLSDYNVVYDNGTLTITQATLTVTAADANRTYGAPNPMFSASATGAQNGDIFTFSETTTATAASPVGTYPIVPLASGTNLSDYNVVYTNGTLTIGKATLTVTAADANRTYGSPNPTFTASATGVENNDTFTYTETTTATPASPIGAYPIVPTAAGSNLSNYTVVYNNGTLTIGQATLTVTAGSTSRIYGSANPVLSATSTGAVNGDTFVFTESTSATPTSPVGAYPIVPVATGTNLSDYNVIYTPGVLTVTQATLTVTAANASREYGIANPDFTATTAGAVNGDTFTVTESTPATISSQIGTYPIIPVATGTNLSDYNVVYSNGTLTIGQATLIVTANSFTKLYGTPNPVFTGTITGALDGDTFTEIFSNSASTLSQPGQYPIIPAATGTNVTDYLQTVQNGVMTITKAPAITTLSLSTTSTVFALPVTFTANVASTTSGTPTGTVTFFDNGTQVNTATLSSSDVATFSTTSLSVGVHTITAVYSGDTDFSSSTASAASGANTINVAPLDFTIVLTSAQTVEGIYGSTRLYTFHVSPTGGYYPGVINLSASPTGPILATYTFSPSTIAQYAGPTDITLTVATRKLASLESPQDRSRRLSHIALGLFLLPLLGLRYSRRSSRKLTRLIIHSLLILSSLGAIGTLTGCGSGYFDRTYPIVVTANSNGIQHTVSVDYHIDQSPQ
ncbi:beta strand repeat-containing protein, partial [Tunturibacter empetritectus]